MHGNIIVYWIGVCAITMGAMGVGPVWGDVQYSDFSDAEGLGLIGDTTLAGDVLRLVPRDYWKLGAAWYTDRQVVSAGFDTTFRFRFDASGGDGLAFVIQSESDSALGGIGGSLGYGTNPFPPNDANGITRSLAIELDTWSNTLDWPDGPAAPHISVNTRGPLPNHPSHDYSLGCVSRPGLSDGTAHTARVLYEPGTLRVYCDDLATPVLTVSADIDALLSLDDGSAWVGFTAATGGRAQQADILDWQLIEVPEPVCALALLLGGTALVIRRGRGR